MHAHTKNSGHANTTYERKFATGLTQGWVLDRTIKINLAWHNYSKIPTKLNRNDWGSLFLANIYNTTKNYSQIQCMTTYNLCKICFFSHLNLFKNKMR